jgi:hypothetical protein
MIYVNTKSVIDGDDRFLIFECNIDDYIPVDFIKNELNYKQIKDKSRNIFNNINDQPELESLMNSLQDENLYKIIDELYESNKFWFGRSWKVNKNKYNTMYDFVKNNTDIAKYIFMDTPGVVMNTHFDDRITFGTFILNLNDNSKSTKFHDYRNNNKIIYEAPKEKGTGVFFLNNENSLHSYIHNGNENRYAMILNVIMKS